MPELAKRAREGVWDGGALVADAKAILSGDVMAALVDMFRHDELPYVLRAWPSIVGWFPDGSPHWRRLTSAATLIIANNVLLGRIVTVRGRKGFGSAEVHGFIDKITMPKYGNHVWKVHVVYAPSSDVSRNIKEQKQWHKWHKLPELRMVKRDGTAPRAGKVAVTRGFDGIRRGWIAQTDTGLVELAKAAARHQGKWAHLFPAKLREFVV
jgi:hypothetical protein